MAGLGDAATSKFAAFATSARFRITPLDRIKIAYSHSTPKRLALHVALVPVKPNNQRIRYGCDCMNDVAAEADSFRFPSKTGFSILSALPRVLPFFLTLLFSLIAGMSPAAGKCLGFDTACNRLSTPPQDFSGPKTTGRTYDRQNRLLSRTDENGQTIGYRYYQSGKLKTLIYPGGTETGTGHVEYTWWTSGNLKQVIDKLDSTTTPRTTSYEWNPDGRLKKVTRPNGTCREIKYDAAGRPEIIEEHGPGGKLIFVHKQGYYPSDEMKWRYELPAKRTSGSDPPAMRAMTYNADNQLATWNGMSVTHDPDGNMTQGPAPDGSSLVSYTYDARNRLTSALGTTYTYDSDNQRVGLTKAGETTTFAIDASSALSKPLVRTKNGVVTRYVWGLGLLYEVNGIGSASTTATYHYDATGSTLALTDDAATVIERIGYTAFGQINHRVNLSGTPHDTPFLFTGFFGNQTDANGLLYMRARYHSHQLKAQSA